MKRVFCKEDLCLGCKRCEYACAAAHSQTGDMVKAFLWEEVTPRSRLHVEGDNNHSVAVNCRHCAKPACVNGCISGALTRDAKTGVVEYNADKCVKCFTCVALCPYGAIRIGNAALKCDLCTTGHANGRPACVDSCINGALVYVECTSGGKKPATAGKGA